MNEQYLKELHERVIQGDFKAMEEYAKIMGLLKPIEKEDKE
ncbi:MULTISPECIES: hypothetical protein [Bacillaceae]|nr:MULTISPECIES: hypothetical protein [Bacillaceae]